MAQQTIGVGTALNDRTGDSARVGGQKINANFTELYTADVQNVKLTGTQTIAGVKTFSDIPVFPAGGFTAGSTTLSEAEIGVLDQASNASNVGAAAAVTGTLAVTIERFGPDFRLTFTLTTVRITVTDGAGAGSYGSTKIFDFVEGAISFLGARQNYTAFVEGAALTTGVGDASFEIGVGTTAISAAADGTLGGGAQEDVGQAVSITNSGGTGTGTAVDGTKTTALDGTGTAIDLYLNWSGTAATIDANSTIDVTGTITVRGTFLGDD